MSVTSSVLVYLPPPMQKRALYMMLARAKTVHDNGEAVVLAYCNEKRGTCSANLAGNPIVCAACRYSSRRTAEGTGLPTLPLASESHPENEGQLSDPELSLSEATEIAGGVQSCLVTVLRVMTRDLNRVSQLRDVKRRYFRTSRRRFSALKTAMRAQPIHRVEVLNGRYACAKIGVLAAKAAGAVFNTLDFNAYGMPMVFKGHTPHDRLAVQNRIKQNEPDTDIASRYFESRRDRSFNVYAAAHQHFEPPIDASGYRKRISFFLSSQDECESLGPSWRSPFRDNQSVIRQACERYPEYYFCVRFHPNQANIVGDITSPYRALKHDNLRLYYPDDHVNTYQLMEWSDVIVTFASTVAIEACWAAKPVVELGPSYFDHLRISYTPANTSDFLTLLSEKLKPFSPHSAAQFANYELNDFDTLPYLEPINGKLTPVDIQRRGGLLAKPAKEINNFVTRRLQRLSRHCLLPTRKSA